MKKILIGTAVFLFLLIITFAVLINIWTDTPHGKLDPATAVFIKIWEAIEPDYNSLTPQEYREKMNEQMTSSPGTVVEMAGIKEEEIDGPSGKIPLRIYIPEKEKSLSVIVYFHGGGWVVGCIDGVDRISRYLAKQTESIVISVDYSLAPENPFPGAVNDAYASLRWAAANAASLGGDPSRIAVAGDSAGGNLAAAVSLMARDRGGPRIKYQVLLFPVTDTSRTGTESYNNFSEGFFLTKTQMQWFIDQYLPEEKDRLNPYASPLLAKSHKGLPPAVVITAQFDPLRDEAEAYAEKLRQAGVPTAHKRFDGMIHGFVCMDSLTPCAFGALDFAAEEMKKGGF